MKRALLLVLFIGLMADSMYGWGLGIAPGLSLKNVFLYVLILSMAMEIAISERLPVVQLPQLQLLFVLLIFIAVLSWGVNSLIVSHINYSPLAGFIALKGSLIDHYLFFLVYFAGVKSAEDVLWLQRWLVLLIGLGCLITVMDAYGILDLASIQTRHDGRVTGPIGEANQFGLFVAMFLPMLIAKAWTEIGMYRLLMMIGAFASLWVLLLTGSRGAIAALVAGTLLSMFFLREHLNAQHVRRLAGIALLAIAAITVFIGREYGGLLVDRFVGETVGATTFDLTSGRNWIWAEAFGILLNDPLSILIGYGWNTFRVVVEYAAHNVYLQRFFELGIFGLILTVAIMLTVLVYARRALGVPGADKELVIGTMGFFFGFSILTIGIASVDLADPWYFIWSYVGLAMRGIFILNSGSSADTLSESDERVDEQVSDDAAQSVPNQPA